MKDVWIFDPNYHKIWWTFALNFSNNNFINALRSYIKFSKECLINIQTLQSWLKNSAAPHLFNPLLSVWISDETLFLVFDKLILLREQFGGLKDNVTKS